MRAWLEERPQDLTEEREFGEASIAHADADVRRKARQRRIITFASVAAAVVLSCATVVAGWQWRQVAAAEEARANELINIAYQSRY